MKKKLYTILSLLLIITVFSTTTVLAGTGWKVTTTLNSLKVDGSVTGLGSGTYTATEDAQGYALVTCTNLGGNAAPGQNYPHASGTDKQTLPYNGSPTTHNGKSPVNLEAVSDFETQPILLDPVNVGGCPNYNWTAKVYFIVWQSVTLSLLDSTGVIVPGSQIIYCLKTTYIPNYTPGDGSTFNDGTVKITGTTTDAKNCQ